MTNRIGRPRTSTTATSRKRTLDRERNRLKYQVRRAGLNWDDYKARVKVGEPINVIKAVYDKVSQHIIDNYKPVYTKPQSEWVKTKNELRNAITKTGRNWEDYKTIFSYKGIQAEVKKLYPTTKGGDAKIYFQDTKKHIIQAYKDKIKLFEENDRIGQALDLGQDINKVLYKIGNNGDEIKVNGQSYKHMKLDNGIEVAIRGGVYQRVVQKNVLDADGKVIDTYYDFDDNYNNFKYKEDLYG